MLERDAYKLLVDWKTSHSNKALLVDGARQIGKTYLIEHFAQKEYSDYVKIDFLENSAAADVLSGADNAQEALSALTLLSGRQLEPKNTLIFLDEVQEAPNVVTLSKYLVQDGRFDIIMSGSLLGVELRHVKSLPVGYLHQITMHPLTFSEFCHAQGVPSSVESSLRNSLRTKTPVEEGVHNIMLSLFRRYLVIGGMPEAVQFFIDAQGDLSGVRAIQENLVRTYAEDIAKHAGDRVLQVKAIYESLPSQLARENKRFLLKTLNVDARFEQFANDFAWITGAHAALKTNAVTEPKSMLKRTEETNRFKLYLSDTGMLVSQYSINIALEALAGSKAVNFGSVYENYVAQQLAAAGIPLFYYHSTKKGELDFLIETERGEVLPIEVKSGKNYKRHVALNNVLKSTDYGISEAYVLSEDNVSTEQREGGAVHYIPLYMLPFLIEEAVSVPTASLKLPPIEW